jgi:hypothetical protein
LPTARSSQLAVLPLLLFAAIPPAPAQTPQTPQALIQAMIDNENAAAARHEHWQYLSTERSSRTGGHLWTERVAETTPGRVRLLLAIDGQQLTGDALAKERARVAAIERDPTAFIKHESSARSEEKRARELLEVLPKDFLFDNVRLAGGLWSLDFHPNPAYTPSGIEERVLHAMAGHILIDAHDLRLLHMDFHLTQDIPIGFGLLGDVHTGTTFVSDRQQQDGYWHTTHIATQVHAKAVLFKNIDLAIDVTRTHFQPLDPNLPVPQAAAMLLQ